MAITISCAAGREMLRTKKQPILIHDNSPGDSPKDRPLDIQNPSNIILPIMKILYFGLSTVVGSRILGGRHKNVDSKHHVIG